MRLIDRKDIERWAEQFDAKGNFPLLISRLIRATAPKDTYVDFPSGNAVFIGGWDGIVKSSIGDGFVPEGISLWELGTEPRSKGKADEDYKKRTENPDGYVCADCTFVFVTPHFWNKKDKWRLEKLGEGKWKDIKVYDSSILEQWLDHTAAVSRWFSAYINKYPPDGILTIEEFWREWSLGPLGQLPPETVTAGRKLEIELLFNFLAGDPGIKAVKAASKDEAIAFILAAAQSFEEHLRERFLARTLIIDTSGNFRSVRMNVKTLNLIARFDEPQVLYTAAADGHHVLVPLGADDTLNQDIIDLPTIDRDGQIDALKRMGLSEADAERFSREAGRDVTILKRLLRFPQNKFSWLTPEHVREVIPAMLIGRWHAQKPGDHALLERLSGMAYENYVQYASNLTMVEEPPLLKIGELYRLLSPLDTWATLAGYLKLNDLELLRDCFLLAFKNGNPLAVPPTEEKRWVYEFNKEKTYSSWAREGLVQSLILVGLYGNNLRLTEIGNSQDWVDAIIRNLLTKADGALWISLDHEMPLLAEAAPEPFLEAIESSLKDENASIMEIFREEEGFLHKNSHHTGLLWALESLAWLPEYLGETALILARLSRLDPGGELSNRPFNSLVEIFKTWHYQTLSTFDERVAVLRQICVEEHIIGWQLLIKLLPESHGIAHPTHKMRWRVFDRNFNLKYTYQDIWEMHHVVVGLLMELFDGSDARLAELLDKSVDLNQEDRNEILKMAILSADDLKDNTLKSWGEIRSILSQHRSHPDTDWALPPQILDQYQQLYELLMPEDSMDRLRWLFDGWPDFPEGNSYDDRQDQKINRRRTEAVNAIFQQHGLVAIVNLSTKVKEPWSLGIALATILTDLAQIEGLLQLIDFREPAQVKFIQNFLGFQSETRDINWIKHLYQFMLENDYSFEVLVKFLTALVSSGELWDMIDEMPEALRDSYWEQMNPWFFRSSIEEKIRGIESLIKYRRFFSAIKQAGYFIDEVPSSLLVNLLESAAMIEAHEQGRFDHHLEDLLDKMENREDIAHDQKIKLEWLYMPVLGSYNARRKPVNLHAELARSPEFFVEALTWLYRAKKNKELPERTEDHTPEMIIRRAESTRKLLNSWQTVPGIKENGEIDGEQLRSWVKNVRASAEKVDRVDVADAQIGLILAKYPERDNDWPPEPISRLIEELDSESINRNFISQVFNNHGSSTRGVFDGGNIERRLADRFNRFADAHKSSHRKLSRLFRDLAKRYLHQAKRMDEEAERDRLEY